MLNALDFDAFVKFVAVIPHAAKEPGMRVARASILAPRGEVAALHKGRIGRGPKDARGGFYSGRREEGASHGQAKGDAQYG
jgi:hypothetical protein